MNWNQLIVHLRARRLVALTICGVLLAVSVALTPRIRFTSDVTEHLPTVSPSVAQWLDLSRRFDAFNSLIVGLEEPTGPMTAEGLTHLKRVTEALAAKKSDGVLSVSSVTNVESITEGSDGSLENALLIPSVPTDEAGLKALREKVAADGQVSGALISRNQRGYLVLVRADPRKDPAALAALVQRTVDEQRGPLTPAWFGAAFFSEVITRGVYAQLPWLVPVFAVLFLGVLAFRLRRPRVIARVLSGAVASLVLWLGLVSGLGVELSFTSLTALLGVLGLAIAAFARGLEPDSPNPFPWPVAAGVISVGVAAAPLRLLHYAYLSNFGLGLALGSVAVLAVGLLFIAPLGLPLPASGEKGRSEGQAKLRWALLAVTLVFTGIATRAHFRATPQSIFRATDEVGRSLSFFDRHFGGPDFIQVSFRGDLRDPNVAARLHRLTDLLEGTQSFPDVRSVTQVLAFLNQGFGGVRRIPPYRESLANLWFFLEGRPDVRNLVSDARDEGMVVLRLPSVPDRPVPELVAVIETAVKDSLDLGSSGARRRLLALAQRLSLPLSSAHLDTLLADAALPPKDAAAEDAEVQRRVRAWLATPDSPYSPDDAQWARLSPALVGPEAERAPKLQELAASIPEVAENAPAFTEAVLARAKAIRLQVRAAWVVHQLAPGAPPPFIFRAEGIVTEFLDPPSGAGDSGAVMVTGLPVVAGQIEGDLLRGLWTALAIFLAVGALALLALTRNVPNAATATLAAAACAAFTLGTTGTFGFGVDSGSAALFLLPPMLAFTAAGLPGSTQTRTAFFVALGAAGLSLLLVGIDPVSRISLALAVAAGSAAIATQLLGGELKLTGPTDSGRVR